MTILYRVDKGLYVNLTNKCPCACIFCIRKDKNALGDCESLWLEKEPSFEDVVQAFSEVDLSQYEEIVFCGYGEPLERIDLVVVVCHYIRQISKLPIRINTNGLSDLIHHKPTAKLLEGCVDSISISLNAPTKEMYLQITKPKFGEVAFKSLLNFAAECKQYIPKVTFSVVDILTKEQIEACHELASKMGIPLRVRKKID